MIDRKTILYMVLSEFEGVKLNDFKDRLILQKRVYLLQLFGIDLGYRYNWYVHGPYCPSLTEDAFEVSSTKDEVRKRSSMYDLAQITKRRLADYRKFEQKLPLRDRSKSLELAASIHFLKHIGFIPGKITKENIKKALRDRGKKFSDSDIKQVWTLLNTYDLIAHKKRP